MDGNIFTLTPSLQQGGNTNGDCTYQERQEGTICILMWHTKILFELRSSKA